MSFVWPPAVNEEMAGVGHPTNSYWLQGDSPGVVGREIRRPEELEWLLDEARRDLPG